MKVLKDIISSKCGSIIFLKIRLCIFLLKYEYFIDKIPLEIEQQYQDNMKWLSEAEKHKLVVGSQARILYSDQVGRVKIALAFNEAVAAGKLKVSLHSDGSSTTYRNFGENWS